MTLRPAPDDLTNVMTKVTALLYHRYMNGAYPIAVVSMDNCSHNGEKLKGFYPLHRRGMARARLRPAELCRLSDRMRRA